MELTRLFRKFFDSEKVGGLTLVAATLLSLLLANSPIKDAYLQFWHATIADHTLVHWINDGLMSIFFLLIGLELEREIYQGELSDIRQASLPIFGAIGGMLLPAAIFLLLNYGTLTQRGAGIPMATDIAFAVGILSLLGNKVPSSLKVFLTALAVIDDLGAIIVIAVFYTEKIVFVNLLIAFGIMGVLFILNRLKVFNLVPYLIGGVIMWYFMLNSGVHATITGVLLAFVIPFGNGSERSPSSILQHFLHKPVAFLILPLFAIANTCIPLGTEWYTGLVQKNSLGIIAGLVIGKPVGIGLLAYAGTLIGLCSLPAELKWKNIIGAGFLGGIGFTMSIFISLLAFKNGVVTDQSKIAILVGSVIAGGIGYAFLRATLIADNPE